MRNSNRTYQRSPRIWRFQTPKSLFQANVSSYSEPAPKSESDDICFIRNIFLSKLNVCSPSALFSPDFASGPEALVPLRQYHHRKMFLMKHMSSDSDFGAGSEYELTFAWKRDFGV